jgi:Fe-S cluster biogenesis protein NfuA
MEKAPVVVYTESTPNPASMKFVANSFLLEEGSVEYLSAGAAAKCPLAAQLFSFSGVRSVFIASNFVTVSKSDDLEWLEIAPILREFIRGYLAAGEPVFTGPRIQASDATVGRTTADGDMEDRIIAALEEYVRPAVEQDGGAILFKSYAEGKVTLILKGACSGCPSSTVTLKSGIENLLRQMVPGVTEVVAEEA